MVSALGSSMVPYRASTLGMTNGIQQTAVNALATNNPSSTALSAFGNAGQVDFSQMFSMFALVMQQFLQLLLSMFQGGQNGLGGSGFNNDSNSGDGGNGPGITQTGAGGSNESAANTASSQAANKGSNSGASNTPVTNTGSLSRPVDGSYPITSRFGDNEAFRKGSPHTGIDIGAPGGTPIKSMSGGRIEEVGTDPSKGRGYYVKVDLGNGRKIYYSHMQSPPSVQVGQSVNQGQMIGKVGTTGFSTGNHLMVEIEENGKMVNPENYFKFA